MRKPPLVDALKYDDLFMQILAMRTKLACKAVIVQCHMGNCVSVCVFAEHYVKSHRNLR